MRKFIVCLLVTMLTVALYAGTAGAYITWVLSPDNQSLDLAVGNTVLVGYNNIGTGSQPQGIFGAGFTMTGNTGGVLFDADLWTLDSYVPGGYWDAFVVNVNTTDFYWNLAGLSDPIASSAPGTTWFWGGQTDGGLEHYAPLSTQSAILSAGPSTYYVSVVLDTKTLPDSDTSYPSWGSFHVNPIPEPGTFMLLGTGLVGLVGYGKKRLLRRKT